MAPLWKRSGTRATGRGAGRLLGRVRGAGESSRGFFGRPKGRSAARDARRVPGKRGNQQPLLQEGEALPGPTVAFAKADEGDAGAPVEDWFRIVLAFLFPALGGLLFGYDIGATSGALVSLTSEATGGVPWFDLTPFQVSLPPFSVCPACHNSKLSLSLSLSLVSLLIVRPRGQLIALRRPRELRGGLFRGRQPRQAA